MMNVGSENYTFSNFSCILLSTLEPNTDKYINYLHALNEKIKLILDRFDQQPETFKFSQSLLDKAEMDQDSFEKMIIQMIPKVLAKILNFNSAISIKEQTEVNDFLISLAKFAVCLFVTDQKFNDNNLTEKEKKNIYEKKFDEKYQVLTSISTEFDRFSAFYKNNSCLKNNIYEKTAMAFLDGKDKLEFYFQKNCKQIELFDLGLKIVLNIIKIDSLKEQASNFIVNIFHSLIDFINKIENLRDINTGSLRNISNLIFTESYLSDQIKDREIFFFVNFVFKCLKSDYLDKQLFAANFITHLLKMPNNTKIILKYYREHSNLITLIINKNLHTQVVLRLKFVLNMLIIHELISIDDLIELWKRILNIHITDRDSEIDLLADILQSFDSKKINYFLNFLFSKLKSNHSKQFDKASYSFLAMMIKHTLQGGSQQNEIILKVLEFTINNCQRSTAAQSAILKITEMNLLPSIREKIANSVVFYLANPFLADFSTKTIINLIKNTPNPHLIFNKEFASQLITLIPTNVCNDYLKPNNNQEKIIFDNRQYIFLILHKIYSITDLKPSKKVLQQMISIQTDDVLWNFFRKLLNDENIICLSKIAPIDEAVKLQNFENATKEFAKFLNTFVYIKNKNIFTKLGRKFIVKSFEINSFDQIQYFDLLLDLYLKAQLDDISNIVKSTILDIYINSSKLNLSSKNLQNLVIKQINYNTNSEILSIDQKTMLRALQLMYDFLIFVEANSDPEDFSCPRHAIQKNLLEINFFNSELKDNQVIHISPKATLKVLKMRLANRKQIKDELIYIPIFANDRDDTELSKIIKGKQKFIQWNKKESYHNVKELRVPIPSVELHNSNFSDHLLNLLNVKNTQQLNKIIWKLLKFLPTNKSASLTLLKNTAILKGNQSNSKPDDSSDIKVESNESFQETSNHSDYSSNKMDFSEFISLLNSANCPYKFRYYMQVLLKSELVNEFMIENGGMNIIIKKFSDPNIPKDEILLVFDKIYTSHELDAYSDELIPGILTCFCNSKNEIITKSCSLLSKFIQNCPTPSNAIIMDHIQLINDIVSKIPNKHWQSFAEVLSELNSCVPLSQFCIKNVELHIPTFEFYIILLNQLLPKIASHFKDHAELTSAKTIFENAFNLCIDIIQANPSNCVSLHLLLNLLTTKNGLCITDNETAKDTNYILEYKKKEIPINTLIETAFNNVDEEIQKVIFKIILKVIKNNDDIYTNVCSLLIKIFDINIDHWNYSPIQFNKQEKYIGLRNLGATCFANSVIQQIFHLFPICYSFLTYELDQTSEYSNLQYLFKQMILTDRPYCDPSIFLNSWHGWYGGTINHREQQDSFEFFLLLIDNIYFPKDISNWFKGEITNIFKGINSDYTTRLEESFYNISLSVKGFADMNESLKEFTQPQTVDDYTVEISNKDKLNNESQSVNESGPCEKQQISVKKYSQILKPPIVLVIQLKRFEYDLRTCNRYKINDKFIFPLELDISDICFNEKIDEEDDDEDDPNSVDFIGKCNWNFKPMNEDDVYMNKIKNGMIYTLHGVVVHTGTAVGGHYFSIIKKEDGSWYNFNDIAVSKISEKDMLSMCYGENNDTTSAYILYYTRKNFSHVVYDQNINSQELTFENEFNFTDEIKSEEILRDNKYYKRTQSFFKESVVNFITKTKNFDLSLEFYIKVFFHSKFNHLSKSFQHSLIKLMDEDNRNRDFLIFIKNNFNDVFNNYLNCSQKDIIEDFNIIIKHSIQQILDEYNENNKDSIDNNSNDDPFDIIFKFGENIYNCLKYKISSYRQIPPILDILYFILQRNTYLAFQNNWLHKICDLIKLVYTPQRSSQFLINCDYSKLLNILNLLLNNLDKDFQQALNESGKKNIDLPNEIHNKFDYGSNFLIEYASNIMKSNNNSQSFAELLHSSTTIFNTPIEPIFDSLLQTDCQCSDVLHKLFSEFVCMCDNPDNLKAKISEFLKGDRTMLKMQKLTDIFIKEVANDSSIFITKFLRFTPQAIQELLTTQYERIRHQIEGIFYELFSNYPRIEGYPKTAHINLKSYSKSILNLVSLSNKYQNQMMPLLENIYIFLDKSNLTDFYPTAKDNAKATNEKFPRSMVHSSSYDIGLHSNSKLLSNEPAGSAVSSEKNKFFRYNSLIRMLRWLVKSIDNCNDLYISFIIKKLKQLRQVPTIMHPDYHIVNFLKMMGDFHPQLVEGYIYKAFKIVFCDLTDSYSYEKELIGLPEKNKSKKIEDIPSDTLLGYIEELEPFIKLLREENHDDTIKVFRDPIYTTKITKIYYLNPQNEVLAKINQIYSRFSHDYPYDITHDYMKRQASEETLHLPLEKLYNMIHPSLPTPLPENIALLINSFMKELLHSRATTGLKQKLTNFLDSCEIAESNNINLDELNVTAEQLISISKSYNENCPSIYKILKWYLPYSTSTQAKMPDLIQTILQNTDNEVLLKETIKFAVSFDFLVKNAKLLKRHEELILKIKMNSPTVSYSSNSSLKRRITAFSFHNRPSTHSSTINPKDIFINSLLEELGEIEEESEGISNIEWMKEYSQIIIKKSYDDLLKNNEKELMTLLVKKHNFETVLEFFADIENDFNENKDLHQRSKILKALANIITNRPDIIPHLQKRTKLEIEDLDQLNEDKMRNAKNVAIVKQIFAAADDISSVMIQEI